MIYIVNYLALVDQNLVTYIKDFFKGYFLMLIMFLDEIISNDPKNDDGDLENKLKQWQDCVSQMITKIPN